MADGDETTQGSEGGETQTDTPPDLAARLTWDMEKQGALPTDLPPPTMEDIQAYADARTAASEQAVHDRYQAAELQRQHSAEQAAAAQTDIEYYDAIRTLQTGTEEQQGEANTALAATANADRFVRGGAAKQQQGTQAGQTSALKELMNGMATELKTGGMEGILPALDGTPESMMAWTQLQPILAQYDGKGGVAGYLLAKGGELALAKAKADGILAEAREEGARDARVAQGQRGAPPVTTDGGTTPSTEKYDDQAWVNAQLANDAEWYQKMSPDGKKTNTTRVREAVLAARTRSA